MAKYRSSKKSLDLDASVPRIGLRGDLEDDQEIGQDDINLIQSLAEKLASVENSGKIASMETIKLLCMDRGPSVWNEMTKNDIQSHLFTLLGSDNLGFRITAAETLKTIAALDAPISSYLVEQNVLSTLRDSMDLFREFDQEQKLPQDSNAIKLQDADKRTKLLEMHFKYLEQCVGLLWTLCEFSNDAIVAINASAQLSEFFLATLFDLLNPETAPNTVNTVCANALLSLTDENDAMQSMIWENDDAKALLLDLIEMTESNIELAVSSSSIAYNCTADADMPDVLSSITPVYVEVLQLDPYAMVHDVFEQSQPQESSSSSSSSSSVRDFEKIEADNEQDNDDEEQSEINDEINDEIEQQLDSLMLLIAAQKLALQTLANMCSDLDSRDEQDAMAALLDSVTATPKPNDGEATTPIVDAIMDRIPLVHPLEQQMGDLSEETQMAEILDDLFQLQLDMISCFNNFVITFGDHLVTDALQEWQDVISIMDLGFQKSNRRWNLVQECSTLMWSLLRCSAESEQQANNPPSSDHIRLILDVMAHKDAPLSCRIDCSGMMAILHTFAENDDVVEAIVSDLLTIAKDISSKRTKPKIKQVELLVESLNAVIDVFAADEWNDVYAKLECDKELNAILERLEKGSKTFEKAMASSKNQDVQIVLDRFLELMENLGGFVVYMAGNDK